MTRNRILKTADKVFSERTYEGARVEEIAIKARVSKSLIYSYFKGKKALLDELLRSFFDEAKRILTHSVRQGGFTSNAERNAEEFAEPYATLFKERKGPFESCSSNPLKAPVAGPPCSSS